MTSWGDLEVSLHPTPTFLVQKPDGRKDWTEINRQATFLSLMRFSAPKLLVFANPNAGKRNPMLARKEGIRAGVFDLTVIGPSLVAYVEFKGYTKAGSMGKLSDSQTEFGNRCHAFGIPCACFFDPYDAADWLGSLGFAIAAVSRR